ncbi:hypothetical protein B5X24_HaOG207328 [Helicoverpa armigera]|uniref:Uncharacterized protein n=1 Tax=Helicoverpa armigera TaxID=29058 RepID=A0A2W1BSJ5_HELAM|nr:hypothetical protein B5X24_HaOG207328 [Helicoverpa armigera]
MPFIQGFLFGMPRNLANKNQRLSNCMMPTQSVLFQQVRLWCWLTAPPQRGPPENQQRQVPQLLRQSFLEAWLKVLFCVLLNAAQSLNVAGCINCTAQFIRI